METLQVQRTKVNGKFLPQFNGKPIAIMGRVLKINPNGSTFEMKSTDNLVVNVILNEPLEESIDGWVEVRGTGQGKTNVIGHHYVVFPKNVSDKFDADVFNDLINVINSCSNPWVNTQSS